MTRHGKLPDLCGKVVAILLLLCVPASALLEVAAAAFAPTVHRQLEANDSVRLILILSLCILKFLS